ncbi:MAG TPA: beta-ketoacyl-ACP synthase 3 [Candidatus Baltobacteraceae bacterium]|nr:beta-ketoacyl-ACP synthase 3 [Candidatus Baltobacteraceae bacterium]
MREVALRAPVRAAAIGMYVPQRVVTNEDLAHVVQTSDEWIVQRTGIRTRRRVAENEYSSDLAVNAVRDLLRAHPEVDVRSIDYVLVSSTTPDYVYPSIAALVQDRIGIPTSAGALDVSAACAGFCAITNIGAALVASDQARTVLLIATEALTRSVDYTDRSTCVLFGDGAAAMLLVRDERCALAGMDSGSDGSAGPALYRTATRCDIGGMRDESGLLRQVGRDVYRWVLENIPLAIDRILDRAAMSLDQVDWFIPHSANMRMIEALCKRIGFPLERTLTSIVEYGNTSAVSIPLALIPAIRNGTVKSGDRILMIGFGGGLVSAGAVLTWL